MFSPESDDRNIFILEKGALSAIDASDGMHKVVFQMHPGDLVGVAALLEHEPFRYKIVATEDSSITVVSEECMESELKTLPVWLLAVIKSLSTKTHRLKDALHRPRSTNTLKSLSAFCSHLQQRSDYVLADLIREFHWMTKIPEATVLADIKALLRRKFVSIRSEAGKAILRIPSTLLLEIFVDYQESIEKNQAYPLFGLSQLQRKVLIALASLDKDMSKSAPAWISFFNQKGLGIDVADWLHILELKWFKAHGETDFKPDTDKIKFGLAAIRYEANLRGVL